MNRQRRYLDQKNGRSLKDKAGQRHLSRATMAPPAELLERRRQQRMRVNTNIAPGSNSGTRLLKENILLCVLLCISIVIAFKVVIYLFQISL